MQHAKAQRRQERTTERSDGWTAVAAFVGFVSIGACIALAWLYEMIAR